MESDKSQEPPKPSESTAIEKVGQKAEALVKWITDKAITGVPPLSSAEDLADEYRIHQGFTSDDDRVDSLINWECGKNFAAGFLAGLGGVMVMPVAIPAILGASWVIQARMSAAIAKIYGHNLDEDRVRTFVLLTLLGGEAAEVLREAGVIIGSKLTVQAIRMIPSKAIFAINKAVGFRLLTKAGSKGVINLVRIAPVVGGAVGGTIDLVACRTVGALAKRAFRPGDAAEGDKPEPPQAQVATVP